MRTVKLLVLLLFAVFTGISGSAQDWAIEQLENSPRHQEKVIVRNGDKEISSFLVYPEVSDDALAIILIHENRGLNDWARSMADQVAGEGFIVIAPDLISGMAPGGGNTPDFPDSDAARDAIYELDPGQVTSDLDAVYEYVKNLPASNGKVAVMGFCWGGSQTFRYATNNQNIEAAFVFYGTAPDDQQAINHIDTPVFGFYGGNDNRVNATIDRTIQMMNKAGNQYDPVTYDGAGHGFMRAGQAPDASTANEKAREEAFERLVELLNDL